MATPQSPSGTVKLNGKLFSTPNVVTVFRIVLGVLFIAASYDKIIDPTAFATSILNYKIFSSIPALYIATFLPWMELLCGLGLVLGVFVRGSSVLVVVMLVLFTFGVASAMARGLDISCGCFTQDPTAEKIGWLKLAENCLLIAMSFIAFRQPATLFSLEHFVQTRLRQNPQ